MAMPYILHSIASHAAAFVQRECNGNLLLIFYFYFDHNFGVFFPLHFDGILLCVYPLLYGCNALRHHWLYCYDNLCKIRKRKKNYIYAQMYILMDW